MKKLFFPALLAILFGGLACSGCKDGGDPTSVAPVNVVFKATFGDQPLVILKKYDYLSGKQALFNRFQFFVGDVELLKANGTTQKLVDIGFVDLNLTDETAAAAGRTLTFADIPVGEYTGIRFGVGVPAAMNNVNPNTLPETDPRCVNGRGEFWSGWQSYIFMKIEGQYDANGDGGAFETSLTYHCGSDAVYRTVTLPVTIDVENHAGHDHHVPVTVDVQKILMEAGQPLDLVLNPRTSDSTGDVVVATKLVDNFSNAFQAK